MKRTFLTAGAAMLLLLSFTSDIFAVDGWASENGGTTGGAGGTVVTVDNGTDFRKYAEANEPHIIRVLGDIYGDFSILSDKTIVGIGKRPRIIGKLAFIEYGHNIIIKNLNITNPYSGDPYDGISVKPKVSNVFITKCTIYDCGDGCLDITNASDYVTISWCKFYYTGSAEHQFVNLIGADDSHTDDAGKLHVTMHHNWWSSRCDQRMPRVRYGRVHVYNNYYGCPGNSYCIGVGVVSQIRVENNYFDNVNSAWSSFNTGGYTPGRIGWNSGNIFYSTSIPTWAPNYYASIFTPPYSYTLDAGADVKAIVMAYAGAPAAYGDFTDIGIVNAKDLEEFINEYWLATADIDDADYNLDGIVNLSELNLLAENWEKIDLIAPFKLNNLTVTSGDSTALLDWDNSDASDLAGYNVYRSTIWAGNYIKLNSLPLSNSNYIDNTVVNGTVYYYVVTAEDSSENESAYSDQASAIPLGPGSIIIQESETGFCGFSGFGSLSVIYDGYTGTGFCNTINMIDSGVIWSIDVPTTGVYTLTWRHSNGTIDSPARLLVDDVEEISSISFHNTGDWEIWETVSQDVTLTAGVRNIKLLATTSKGLSSIDYMMVAGNNPAPAGCP
ncbi:MAG: carbohydrate-binding protein [Sedimentisphaerales bacterium]|nr:carbohydrate-binding protein [Sedimentisphaerales bacterium]